MNWTKSFKKIIPFMVVLLIVLTEIFVIPIEVYAASDEFNRQNNSTNNGNVKFDAYFSENDSSTRNITVTNSAVINFALSVQKGYLSNIKILLDNPNFSLNAENNADISAVSDNVISLNDITSAKNIQIPIQMQVKDSMRLEDLEKETTVTLQATYVNNDGKEMNIQKDMLLKLKWNLNTEINLSSEITNFLSNNAQTILQQKVYLQEKERKSPIEETKLIVNVPEIQGELPSEVRVFANSTKATNGDIYGVNFSSNNYVYDAENRELTILVQNLVDANNEVSFLADKDEYVITYVYNKNMKDLLKTDINITSNVISHVKTYNNENVIVNQDSKDYVLNKQVGSNLSAEVYSNDLINKGFLYDNYNETNYNLYYKININNKDANEIININTNNTVINYGDGEGTTDKIYYKSLAINADLFNKVLGEDGYINIYDSNNNLIGTINKDSTRNDNGELEVSYKNYQNNIKIEISKPLVEGYIELRNSKVIDKKLDYNINLIKDFETIKEKIKIDKTYEGEIKLNETYTKVDLQLDNTNLTPFVDNTVNLTLNLVTNSNAYDLFRNPEIRIVFPHEISSIDIGEISLLYNTELKLESANLNNNELVIKLSGEETNYKLGIQEGTKILIPAVIRLKDTVSTKECNLKMTYSNDLAKYTEYSAQNKDCTNVPFNITAKSGLITISSLSGYNGKDSQMTLDENYVIGQVPLNSDAKTANINTSFVNNFESEISSVRILGRLPVIGNTDINGVELGTNFDANLKKALKTSGVNATVYYSENNEIDENSTNWKADIENIANAKSYKIVLNENMPKGQEFNFSYDFNIPEQLSANQKAYATYTVKYNLAGQELQTTQTLGVQTPEIQATNTETPDAQVTQANTATTGEISSIDMTVKEILGDTEIGNNSNVHEREVIRYEIEVKNNSTTDVQNVSVDTVIPDEALYLTRYSVNEPEAGAIDLKTYKEERFKGTVTFDVGTLKANESKIITYEVRVDQVRKVNAILVSDILLKINGEVQKETRIENNILDAIVETELFVKKSSSAIGSNQYTYIYKIRNMSSENINDINATVEIPNNMLLSDEGVLSNGLSDSNNTDNASVVRTDNILTCKINTLEAGKEAKFQVIGELQYINSVDEEITALANAYLPTDTYKSNLSIIDVDGADVQITMDSPTMNQQVKNGDTITYNITVTNNSNDTKSQISIVDTLPKEVTAKTMNFNQFTYDGVGVNESIKETNKNVDFSVTIEDEGGEDTSIVQITYDKEKNQITIPSILPAGKTINITINAVVDKVTQDTELINIAEVNGDNIVAKTSNEVRHFAIYDENNPDNPDNPNNPGDNTDDPNNPSDTDDSRYTISGSIWLDTNANGIMDSSEDLISGNEVILVDAETSEIIENDNGQEITATSSGSGYTLRGLKPGKYIVVFKYDRNNYKITQYKADGQSDLLTSKAIATTATIDGNEEYVGMTDVIEITDSDVNYINMGLITTATYDIGIDKVITGVYLLQNNGDQRTYNYNDVKLGKLEIRARNIEGATINIEYKITLSNNGATKGYIQAIVDELPDDLTFNQSLNKNWYEENDKLYNTQVNELNAGESKTVTLIATKKLTQENLGIVSNSATFEASNTSDTLDSNSENNTSSARLIIGTSTGRTILNISIMIVLLVIIAGGIYYIRRFTKNNKGVFTK